ncbi:MAG: tyrosine-type recombinase/integrase [Abitibacteriaceae bacterium]|nr:tyrosine-type recombinase/integrase [Abditibacteriaceae bacterium]
MSRRPLTVTKRATPRSTPTVTPRAAKTASTTSSKTASYPASSAGAKTASKPTVADDSQERGKLALRDIESLAEEWLLDCEYRLHSPQTLQTRRVFLTNLCWFLKHRHYQTCGTRELKEFLHYLRHGHEEGGRWGRKHLNKPVRPVTVKDYHVCLSTFFKWLVAEGILPTSPMERIPRPVVRFEEKQPLTPAEVKALFGAARKSLHPQRNELILLLLLDTGIRASELCGLKVQDMDLNRRFCSVLGKGNKRRVVYFGVSTGSALRVYLRQRAGRAEEPLFLSIVPGVTERPLTRSGLLKLIERLANAAGIQRSCSPHVLRRTFAIQWLRGGGDIFALQSMLGHTNLQMTQRYLSLARADIEAQARQFSPADQLRAQIHPGR